jgi:hypothetical protein
MMVKGRPAWRAVVGVAGVGAKQVRPVVRSAVDVEQVRPAGGVPAFAFDDLTKAERAAASKALTDERTEARELRLRTRSPTSGRRRGSCGRRAAADGECATVVQTRR